MGSPELQLHGAGNIFSKFDIFYQTISLDELRRGFHNLRGIDTWIVGKDEDWMTYVITEPCVGVKDGSCVDVCPVDCIHSSDSEDMFYIDPVECIDCAACEPVCPVTAIFHEYTLPPQWYSYIAKNAAFFP